MKNFLLIDDDDITCMIHSEIIKLAFSDCNIKIISSSFEALLYLSEFSESELKAPDIIFLDINLPEMSGFELLEKLSSKALKNIRQSRILLLSSSIDPRDLKKAKENPLIEKFLGKPLSVEFLRNELGC